MGRNAEWQEKILVLQKLASYGVSENKRRRERKSINWSYAIKQHPELWEQLGKPNTIALSKYWNHYKYVVEGCCYFYKRCGNQRDKNSIYCSECRKKQNENGKEKYRRKL